MFMSIGNPVRRWQSLSFGLGCLCGILLLSGCASPAMKGTPFYTGEYANRQGAAAERINAWPLLYYRDPALSVLWPIGELTDDHLAIRPLFSLYGLDDGKHVVNVLWPVTQFDLHKRDYRIFPVFWGDDYSVLFPLVWHFSAWHGRDARYDAVLPLFSWYRHDDGQQYNAHLLWPIVQVRNETRHKGWRVFPAYGTYNNAGDQYRFFLWPLGHHWRGAKDNGKSGSCLIPVWLGWESTATKFLATPAGGYGKDKSSGELKWLFTPLAAFGRKDAESGSTWLFGPLTHLAWDQENRAHHLFPVYAWNGWNKSFASALFATWRQNDRDTTLVPPLFSWYTTGRQRHDLWLLGGLAHQSWGENAGADHLLPFYYYNPKTTTLTTPVYARWQEGDRDYQLIPPLLSLRETKADQTESLVTPLFGFDRGDNGFFYPLTPLAGIYRGKRSGNWLFPLWAHRRWPETGGVNGDFLLWGKYWRRDDRGGAELWPFFGYHNYGKIDQSTAADSPEEAVLKAPVTYGGRSFWCLPAFWYRNVVQRVGAWQPQLDLGLGKPATSAPPALPTPKTTAGIRHTRKHGLFPFYRHSRELLEQANLTSLAVDSALALILFDYRHENRVNTGDTAGSTAADNTTPVAHDYTRTRILWRLWHYERSQNETSIDIFPAITIDRKPDGFRQYSFLWRLFRYQQDAERTKKLDLLFVPILR